MHRRIRSNTPLQALTLLNDEGFFELAEGLARSVLRDGPANEAERIEYAFRVCVSRPPKAAEVQRLREFLEQLLAENGSISGPGAGAIPAQIGASQSSNELAAWTTVARVLLNLDETITRE